MTKNYSWEFSFTEGNARLDFSTRNDAALFPNPCWDHERCHTLACLGTENYCIESGGKKKKAGLQTGRKDTHLEFCEPDNFVQKQLWLEINQKLPS